MGIIGILRPHASQASAFRSLAVNDVSELSGVAPIMIQDAAMCRSSSSLWPRSSAANEHSLRNETIFPSRSSHL